MEDIQTIIMQKDSEIESLRAKLQDWEYCTRNYINCSCQDCVNNISAKLNDPTSHCKNVLDASQSSKYPFASNCSGFELKYQ